VGRGTPLRLTNKPDSATRYPAWSPDGQMIAFVRLTAGKTLGDLVVIPALGGPERRIDEAWPSRPAWSPDGKWLYFSSDVSPETHAVFVQASAGGEKRRLTDPPAGSFGDGDMSVSQDGRKLAFVRFFANFNADLFIVDLQGGNAAGAPRRLTNDHRKTFSPVWTTNGEEIVYISGEQTSLNGIYRVRASGGPPRRVEGINGDYAQLLAVAPRGQRLAYSRSYRDNNIYRMPLPGSGGPAGAPVKFLSSTRFEESPAYSPNGTRIAFSSNRGGVQQIWVADADGANPVPLTNFAGGGTGSPKWSPDGQTIVFDARPEGLADIYSVSAQGGTPKRLTDNPAEDHVPCYSGDGRWIYFASTRSGDRQLYRMPAGGGEAVQVTRKGAYVSVPSRDGKWIYYSKPGGAIWRVPVDGSEETPVLAAGSLGSGVLGNLFTFDVAASGIYFAGASDADSRARPLKLYRFADSKTVEIGHFDKHLRLHLGISPDEKWLVYAQLDSSVDDLMLVENFR
jgi:Tol biopolymer transport system component